MCFKNTLVCFRLLWIAPGSRAGGKSSLNYQFGLLPAWQCRRLAKKSCDRSRNKKKEEKISRKSFIEKSQKASRKEINQFIGKKLQGFPDIKKHLSRFSKKEFISTPLSINRSLSQAFVTSQRVRFATSHSADSLVKVLFHMLVQARKWLTKKT